MPGRSKQTRDLIRCQHKRNGELQSGFARHRLGKCQDCGFRFWKPGKSEYHFKYFPSGTYVVSIDDDVEGIAWKCREGMKHAECLRPLPAGGLERIIFDAHQQMLDNCAFLWGLNTSQNPRHMRTHGLSMKNGLVCGYLNGFICRPECPELLRQLTDATEDSEFAVRHFAKDGVVLRYRMYCGITRPYSP
jgi:hypothetical protein